MASILASGTSEADSSTFTLNAGDSATLAMFGAAEPVPSMVADVQIQGSDGGWTTIGQLRGAQGESSKVLTAVGTFRVHRRLSPAAFGVDQN